MVSGIRPRLNWSRPTPCRRPFNGQRAEQIDDGSFVAGIQWLISNGIMTIPPTEQGTGSDDVIPSWIKNNAGWWADGQIDDNSFVTGLQWLISNGIMKIS